jgi:hypothetical protein
MINSIDIYWSCLEPEWVRSEPPSPVLSNFNKNNKFPESRVNICPAFYNEHHNLYGLKSLYDYEFTLDQEKKQILSGWHDQSFFNRHVIIRSIEERIFTFSQEFVFFTDADSILITGCIYPYLEDNNITERCVVYPGKFDIGRWYRPIEFAFKLKESFDTFKIAEGEIYQYIRFHTDKKINFKQFRESKKLNEILKDITNTRSNKKGIFPLSYYYEKFKMKKMIMKEIKENLL